jgi:hypothetical protein
MITLDNKLKEFNNKFMNTKATIDEKMNNLTSDIQKHSEISNDLAERVNEHILKTTAQWKEQYNQNQQTILTEHRKHRKNLAGSNEIRDTERDMFRGIQRDIGNVQTNTEILINQFKQEVKVELDQLKIKLENGAIAQQQDGNETKNAILWQNKQQVLFQQMMHDTKATLIDYVDTAVTNNNNNKNNLDINASDDGNKKSSHGREANTVTPNNTEDHASINGHQDIYKDGDVQATVHKGEHLRQLIEAAKKELYHHVGTVESKVENGYNVLYEYIDNSIDVVSKRFVKEISTNKHLADKSLAKVKEDVHNNANAIDSIRSTASAKLQMNKSVNETNMADDTDSIVIDNVDTGGSHNSLQNREIASKRLARRLALELKRHESGDSDNITKKNIDSTNKVHLHRSGSVTITNNNSNNQQQQETVGETIEQKVTYGTNNNNNNYHTQLDDELDSVLAQISQVHKLVNSTNEQFTVLRSKLSETDQSKLNKRKSRKRSSKKHITGKKKRNAKSSKGIRKSSSDGHNKKKILRNESSIPLWKQF